MKNRILSALSVMSTLASSRRDRRFGTGRICVLAAACLMGGATRPECLGATEPGQPAERKRPVVPATAEFKLLFNGRDLTGWKARDGRLDAWTVEGELLSCVAEGGGWLVTEKPYSDFVLKLEYRIPPGGNSGVGLRLPPEGEPHHAGMEIQILDNDAPQYKDLKAEQFCGSVYYQAAAEKGATKPAGEWNSYEITCLGPFVKVVLNGRTIVDIELDLFTEAKGGVTPLADRPETGVLGLQSHGTRVDFRRIELANLAQSTNSGLQYADLLPGEGAAVAKGGRATVHYTGRLLSGKKFDSSRDRGEPFPLSLTRVIEGWAEGVPGMKVGGRRKLIIPPELGYGERGAGGGLIPPQATLVFDVEVLAIE